MLKKQLIKDWCAQSWNMEVLFGLSGTGMTSLTLCFPLLDPLLECQMIVCPSPLRSLVLGTNFPPIRTPGEIISFGVSPVNYSVSDL